MPMHDGAVSVVCKKGNQLYAPEGEKKLLPLDKGTPTRHLYPKRN
jgi:hypothetical protein